MISEAGAKGKWGSGKVIDRGRGLCSHFFVAQKKNDRIVCLFGSGVSAAANIPTMTMITERILPLPYIRHGSDWLFELGEPTVPEQGGTVERDFGIDPEHLEDVRVTVNTVADLIREFRFPFDGAPPPFNYEEVAYTLDRIWRLESHRAFDPCAAMVRDSLIDRLRSRPRAFENLEKILRDSIFVIEDLAINEITAVVPITTELGFFTDLIRETGPANVTIITTNHDTLLEHHVKGMKLRIEDGFSSPRSDSDIARWSPVALERRQSSIRLIKVHGSVDWHRLRRNDGEFEDVIRLNDEPETGANHEGSWSPPEGWELSRRSVVLVGSQNKPGRYTSGSFGELFRCARREIMRAQRILVCGYGFRDEGINMMLVDWAWKNRNGHLIVVAHRGFDQLTTGFNDWMRQWFDWRKERGRLTVVEDMPVQKLSWRTHIRPCLTVRSSNQ